MSIVRIACPGGLPCGMRQTSSKIGIVADRQCELHAWNIVRAWPAQHIQTCPQRLASALLRQLQTGGRLGLVDIFLACPVASRSIGLFAFAASCQILQPKGGRPYDLGMRRTRGQGHH
mmetsp:Transcript_18930/g.31711  ORF Transcript_18930/g.31711 Transcript_18930/m.31711 type:complete len:118 (+) Transcript_18930:27-380(+)|eukprot:CAMPEP_0119307010 /NCGR_PEP_ID=MMETSP1333-20130426/7623_1 /TAXON_ID=418940 /ORGANISM="Scyphosphaera apsteinii, Strain RCC1455" /LENGTH=117 /DNA_ID=CAMNT_0007310461 /DNA_START=290 /DNA_END=643 /DNA_ORIENTATION=-